MDAINEKHGTTFSVSQIQYRIMKISEETKGKAHLDAYEFVKLAEEDVKKNDGYFCYMKKSNNEFDKCLYISSTMLTYSDYFLDIILIDSTYRRNRFNLVLVNILGVNNYGRNIMMGFGLLSSETKENYIWLFSKLKRAWENREPKNIITDEDLSIAQGFLFHSSDFFCFSLFLFFIFS